jgi:hypothetical protein
LDLHGYRNEKKGMKYETVTEQDALLKGTLSLGGLHVINIICHLFYNLLFKKNKCPSKLFKFFVTMQSYYHSLHAYCLVQVEPHLVSKEHTVILAHTWIRTCDKRIRIQIQILLFLSVTFKTPTRRLFLFEDTFASFFKDKKSYRSHKTVGIKVFNFFAC